MIEFGHESVCLSFHEDLFSRSSGQRFNLFSHFHSGKCIFQNSQMNHIMYFTFYSHFPWQNAFFKHAKTIITFFSSFFTFSSGKMHFSRFPCQVSHLFTFFLHFP